MEPGTEETGIQSEVWAGSQQSRARARKRERAHAREAPAAPGARGRRGARLLGRPAPGHIPLMAIDFDRLKAGLADRYELLEEVGSGGMATVYAARDLKHNRRVAIKVLLSNIATALGTERFLLEIETAANLTHPHILPLYDSGEADGYLFYVMPYLDGESLRDRLDRETQLPLEEALAIAREIADALRHAHEGGIVDGGPCPASARSYAPKAT